MKSHCISCFCEYIPRLQDDEQRIEAGREFVAWIEEVNELEEGTLSQGRGSPLVTTIRHDVMYLLRKMGWGLKEIGLVLNRDHSSVSAGVERARERRAS